MRADIRKFSPTGKAGHCQSKSRDPAEYSMQRWRDTEHFSRLLSMPDKYGILASWLLWRSAEPLKDDRFHRVAPQRRPSPAVDANWRPKKPLHTVRFLTEKLWRREAPNAALAFCGKVTHPHRSFLIRKGSTLCAPRAHRQRRRHHRRRRAARRTGGDPTRGLRGGRATGRRRCFPFSFFPAVDPRRAERRATRTLLRPRPPRPVAIRARAGRRAWGSLDEWSRPPRHWALRPRRPPLQRRSPAAR